MGELCYIIISFYHLTLWYIIALFLQVVVCILNFDLNLRNWLCWYLLISFLRRFALLRISSFVYLLQEWWIIETVWILWIKYCRTCSLILINMSCRIMRLSLNLLNLPQSLQCWIRSFARNLIFYLERIILMLILNQFVPLYSFDFRYI